MHLMLLAQMAAFIAFLVWLSIRIINRRERWAIWTAAITVAATPALYLLSFGIACAWGSRSTAVLPVVYRPFGAILVRGPNFAGMMIHRYARIWMPDDSAILLSFESGDGVYDFVVRLDSSSERKQSRLKWDRSRKSNDFGDNVPSHLINDEPIRFF